ncbi:ABC transporter ATPase [Pseudonocardia sulfidoxydans NBRC 16205]|uniref:ABC transporter ATPase n=1 Tax=Pseudonocardia sulfidoxydans NBRC 16205 TaxID=1223511 RepID=A0A511DLT0_9PSEU|nr:ATP-binding cassette domain-containing protein [Pseudonocardia sulfidoxydans]GEL25347.1 ABC transporter ATPase [Pseudonocardia sulfidoxydans NBRC 16205]
MLRHRSPLRTAHVRAVDVHVARGGRPVLRGLDLVASPGDRIAVVGENGRGKSTLLQVLTGTLAPDRGEVHVCGGLGVADQTILACEGRTVGDLIDLELTDAHAALRDLDTETAALAAGDPGDAYSDALAAAEALDAWDADRRVDIALAALGAVDDRARLLSTLSVGQRHRVRLACLLGARYDVLLLDEPTNHLDAAGLDHLTAALREHPGVVVVVSHDRTLLADVATTVVDLDPSVDGRPRCYGGGWAGYVAGREAERARWEALHAEQVERHRQLADDLSAAQNRLRDNWRPPKGTGRHVRATRAPALVRAVHRRQDDLDAHLVDVPPPPRRFTMPDLPAHPGTLLSADGVSVLVTGPNGAGKSTLLAVLAGALVPDHGAVTAARDVRIGRLGQESAVSEGTALPSELGLLGPDDVGRRLAELSVGARRRVDLAHVLAARPHVLLLDEPTNHLSPTLVDELTAALRATAAVVVATHDRGLLADLADWPRLHLSAG